jgi:Domain of unknown function (DUF3303)
MLFLTTYRVKPYLPRSELKKLLDLFGKVGAAPGTIAHYVAADNSIGWVVVENEDAVTGYAASLPYSEYIEFDTKPILTIEDALPHLLEAYQ